MNRHALRASSRRSPLAARCWRSPAAGRMPARRSRSSSRRRSSRGCSARSPTTRCPPTTPTGADVAAVGRRDVAAPRARGSPTSASAREFLATVHYEATRAGLDPQLVLGVIQHESDFRKYAVSTAGARGYMQVMPFWTQAHRQRRPQPVPPAHQPALRLRDPAPLPRHRERRPTTARSAATTAASAGPNIRQAVMAAMQPQLAVRAGAADSIGVGRRSPYAAVSAGADAPRPPLSRPLRALAHRPAALRLARRRARELLRCARRGRRMAACASRTSTCRARAPAPSATILATLERYGFAWDGAGRAAIGARARSTQTALARLRDARRRLSRARARAASSRRRRSAPAASASTRAPAATASRAIARGAQRARAGACASAMRAIAFGDRLQGAQAQDLARDVGDFVVRRADGLFAYQLAVVVDDARAGRSPTSCAAPTCSRRRRGRSSCSDGSGCPTPSYLHVPVAIDARGRKALEADAAPRRCRDDPAAGAPRRVALSRPAAARGSTRRATRRRILGVGDRARGIAGAAAADVRCCRRQRGSRARRAGDGIIVGSPATALPFAAAPIRLDTHDHARCRPQERRNRHRRRLADDVRRHAPRPPSSTARYDKIVHYRAPTSACAAAPRTSSCSRACSRSTTTSTSRTRPRSSRRSASCIRSSRSSTSSIPKEEEDDPYESTQITALIANEHGIFGVYSMREVFEYTRFWAVGSGREFALGAMHALYAPAEDRRGRRASRRRGRRDCSTRTRRCR